MKLYALLACALALVVVAPNAEAQPRANRWYTQGTFAPTERIEIRIRNDLPEARRNNPVIVRRDQLAALPDVHELAITLVDPSNPGRAEPSAQLMSIQGTHEARRETNGAWIPYQVDDFDRDGQWDELFFMTDIGPSETKTFYIYLGFMQWGWQAHRTHAGIGSYVRHTVPFWESENVGWKLWFPTDIDVYGKRQPVLMSQHLYMENLDGYGVSRRDPAWGSDIMQVNDSFGGGGIGVFDDPANVNAISRPRFTPLRPAGDTSFNAGPRGDTRYSFEVIANGPVRSMVRARTLNWNSGHGRYEVEQIYTAFAGESYATSRVRYTTFAPQSASAAFAVGIRKHVGERDFYQRGGIVISGAPEAIRNPDDTESFQNSLMVDFAGTALVVRDAYAPSYYAWPDFDNNHVFRVPANAERSFEYLIAAGWSEGAVNKTPAEFQDYVLRTAREYNAPLTLVGQKLERR